MDESHFTCPLCLELASEARQTNCCHHLFCLQCIRPLRLGKCPICRFEGVTFSENALVSRILGDFPATCPFECNSPVTRGILKDHIKTCHQRLFRCPVPTCVLADSMTRDLFLSHMISQHAAETADAVSLSFTRDPHQGEQVSSRDVVATRTNTSGLTARLGATGKYFCARPFLDREGARCCGRCDGHCGPINGCNCPDCMQLDLEARGLPNGYLVNRDGFAARKGDEEDNFFCGREVLVGFPGCDGYCGPNNGPNCNACAFLDCQANGLYVDLMEWRRPIGLFAAGSE